MESRPLVTPTLLPLFRCAGALFTSNGLGSSPGIVDSADPALSRQRDAMGGPRRILRE